jgi:hypothetical protein
MADNNPDDNNPDDNNPDDNNPDDNNQDDINEYADLYPEMHLPHPGILPNPGEDEMDNMIVNNNNNNLYSIIGYGLVIGVIYDLGNWLPISSVTTPLSSFLAVYALRQDLVDAARDFIEDLQNYEELVNLAKKITFLYLFGMLGIQDGGGNKLSKKTDKQIITDFTNAFDKLPQETKNKLKQFKTKFQNVFCMKSLTNIGGVRKRKTNKLKNKRKSRRKGKI